MRARAEGLGGLMTIADAVDTPTGTYITWTIPLTAGVQARPPVALI